MAKQVETCVEDNIQGCLSADLVKTYKTIFSLREFRLPFTTAEFLAFFGPKINFFASDGSNRDTGVSSNTVITNAVDMPFLVRCITVYLTVEALGFTAVGAAIAAPTTPDTAVPFFDGIQIANAQGVLGIAQPAWLEWGLCTWKAAHALMQAYRLVMLLGGRLELFSELGADVGSVDSHSQWVGFSSSFSELPQYVSRVNARQAEIGRTTRFLPPTGQTVALIGAPTVPVQIGVPTPTVPASWGGPKMDGMFCGGCYPVRGILFVPGMPINLNLVRDDGDTAYYEQLQLALTQADNVRYDANWGASVVFNGNAIASVNFTEYKGGNFRLGIAMRGFELTPRAAVEWYGTYGGSFGQTYQVAAMQSDLQRYQIAMAIGPSGGLNGAPGLDIGDWVALGAPGDWRPEFNGDLDLARATADQRRKEAAARAAGRLALRFGRRPRSSMGGRGLFPRCPLARPCPPFR